MMLLNPFAFLPAAFVAGLLMFLAPCTLPLVPGYLAFIAGGHIGGTPDASARRRLLINALAFVLGFSVIFVVFGVFAASLGAFFGPWRFVLGRVAGIIVIFFGLVMLGMVRIPVFSSVHRIPVPNFLTLGRWESSFFLGVLFAVGWSPCIGPILGSLLLFASISATMSQGALLLVVFSIGLGIPFILVALFLGTATSFIAHADTLIRIVSVFGGCVLIALGVLMLLGDMGILITVGYQALSFIHYDHLLNYM